MSLNTVRKEYERLVRNNPDLGKKHFSIAKMRWAATSYDFDTDDEREGKDPFTLEEVEQILDGEFFANRKVEDHINVRNYKAMIAYLYTTVTVKDKADLELIHAIHRILKDGKVVPYRQRVPIVKEFAFVPTHYQSIDEELDDVLKAYLLMYDKWGPVRRGCFLHNEFIKIYPYDEFTTGIARALLNFELIVAGYLPLAFDMDIAEYRKCVSDHIKMNHPQPFYDLITRSLEEMYRDYLDYSAK